MIVYFSAISRNIKEDIAVYRLILDTVHRLGHTVTHSWVESAWHRATRGERTFGDIESIVADTATGVESAEVIIAEASDTSTFGVGYEVARALHFRKPILLLVKKGHADNSYAKGLKDDLITFKEYDEKNVVSLVETFIKDNLVTGKDLRFNFVIDRQIYNHLRLKSFKTRKTKAEIMRELLQNDMDQAN